MEFQEAYGFTGSGFFKTTHSVRTHLVESDGRFGLRLWTGLMFWGISVHLQAGGIDVKPPARLGALT